MRSIHPSVPIFLSLLTFAACGGGGGGGNPSNPGGNNGGNNGGSTPTPSAALSSLQASATTAPADGTTEILLTVVVRDTNGAVLGDQSVGFEASGLGIAFTETVVTADAGGLASTRLTSTVPGPVTVAATISTGSSSVRLDSTLTITFTPVDAPVVSGAARYQDVDNNAALNAGDKLIVPFSRDVVVNGAVASDFVLPVQGDSFGDGAIVTAGPASNEVTIVLGDQARLRSRGRFDAGQVAVNAASGIDVQSGVGITSATTSTAANASAPVDISPDPAPYASVLRGGQIIAYGDFDGDFLPDILISNNGVLTPICNLNGALAPGLAVSSEVATAVAIANLNRIGLPEIITGDAIGVRIWNNTANTFDPPVLQEDGFIATGPANDLMVADVNDDGFPDIVTATNAGVVIAVHQRNLGNTYAIGQSIFFSEATQAVFVCDLDGDGDLDVLALQASATQVLRNDAGTFTTIDQIDVASAESVSAGDVDGDANIDLLFVAGGSLQLFERTSSGSFAGTPLGIQATSAELSDLDGDSLADIVVADQSGLNYLVNDRSGNFNSVGQVALPDTTDLACFDLERDGDVDVVALDAATLSAFSGSLAGTFGDATLTSGLELGTEAIGKQALGDLNGDGFADRVVATANGAQVWFGDNSAGFTVAGTFGQASPTAIALGDMDNDGDLDAVLGSDQANVPNEVYTNNGSGQFVFARAFSQGTITRSFGLTDFDNDGDLDVFVGNDGTNELYLNQLVGGAVVLSLDTVAFQLLQPQALGNETIAVLVVDFDRDGDDDIILINGGTITSPQDAYVLRRSGNGYTLGNTFNAQLLATSAVLGDVDSDGRNDLAIAQVSPAGNASVKWYRGFNTTISTQPSNIATNGQYFSRSLIIADFDGDGRSDIIVGDVSVSNQPIAVIRGQASGGFQVSQEFPTTRLEQIAAGDFDNDGDVDLVTVETTGPSRVLENR